MKTIALDLTGRRVGRLKVIRRVANSQSKKARWLCKCDCGGTSEVNASSLNCGLTKSCGCLIRENCATVGSKYGADNARRLRTTHGHTAGGLSPTYRSWAKMKNRCDDSKTHNYKYYGARGITYCERWQSFENFLADMGERPDGLTLDRIDNNGNYEPGNCRWATWRQQRANQRKPSEMQ